MRNYISIFILSFIGISGFSQNPNLDYPRKIISELTSSEFSGRGYVDNGMQKSAEFIANEFQQIGVHPLNDSYFQEFSMKINVIKDAKLKINGKELQYGIDFLVDPASTSQSYHSKDIYQFEPIAYQNALKSEKSLSEFIYQDIIKQQQKHIVFPPHQFEVDSLNQYYKHWANFYRADENKDRAIFYFSSDKLTASLSSIPNQISRFFIQDEYYRKDLSIDDYSIDSEYIQDFKASNVIGKIKGKNQDSLIVITAHYDHLGKVGNTIFPGANDNASGTAFLLSMAKHFAQNQPEYDMVFIAFAAEEAGLLGSDYFVKNPLIDLSKIKFLLNFDIMGAGEEGIQIVNSAIFNKEYELLQKINTKHQYLNQIKKRGEACNSDHCPFYQKGVPSFFTYTLGGKGYYHDPLDTAESIDLNEFHDIQNLFIEFIKEL